MGSKGSEPLKIARKIMPTFAAWQFSGDHVHSLHYSSRGLCDHNKVYKPQSSTLNGSAILFHNIVRYLILEFVDKPPQFKAQLCHDHEQVSYSPYALITPSEIQGVYYGRIEG